MDKYTVLPADDGVDMRSNWQVKKNGTTKSTHTKKSAAKRSARQMASPGDTLQIRRTDGSIQSTSTVTRASGSSDSEDNNGGGGRLPGMGTFKTGIGFD